MDFIEVLAPMAGITNGAFCRNLAVSGFDMVTLGGYNVDPHTIQAGKKILARGRSEFDIHEEDIIPHLKNQTALVKDQERWEGMVSVNLRSISPKPIIEISKIREVDVVEINAHCRQPELTHLNCGQALLKKPEELENFTREVVKKSKSQVSVKVRANVPGVDDIHVARVVESTGADYLHVDAMKPGYDDADYELIKSICEETSVFLIGNNSIRDVESARKMLAAGADGISVARAAINGSLNFDLSRI